MLCYFTLRKDVLQKGGSLDFMKTKILYFDTVFH